MEGKVIVVTGANSGIGFAFAKQLAQMGAQVVLACRDEERGRSARRQIVVRSNNRNVETLPCDLLSESSIHRFAERFADNYPRLDVLYNNAGATFFERQTTSRGVEYNFMVNYLGHFILTNLLLDQLLRSENGRIINMVGMYYKRGKIDFANLQSETAFDPMQAASNALLAKMLFTKELVRRLAGTPAVVNAYHPGPVRTPLQRKLPLRYRLLAVPVSWFFRSPEQGAKTAVQLAVEPAYAQVSGKYFYDGRAIAVAPPADDPVLARQLWDHSVELSKMDDKKGTPTLTRSK